MSRRNTTKVDPSSPWFIGFMIFFWFMTLYILLLALTVAEAGNQKIWGLVISQCLWPVLAILMTISRIRYRVEKHLVPHPWEFLKKTFLKARAFLFPLRYRITDASGKMREAAAETIRFREEYKDFFESGKISEHVTPLFRHQLKLHRQRLLHQGIRMETDWSPVRIDEGSWVTSKAHADGRMVRHEVGEHVRGRFVYSSQGRQLFTLKGFLGADFDVIGARYKASDAEGVSFQCPNCGAYSSGKEMVNGCPYCGTVFHMEELENRVGSFSLFKDPFYDRRIVGMKINGHLNRLAAGAALLELAGTIPFLQEAFAGNGGHFGWGGIFVVLLFSATAFMTFWFLLALNYVVTVPLRFLANAVYKKRQERRSEELADMAASQKKADEIQRRLDQDFSLGSFMSNVRNKTASIHYADTWQEIEAFSEEDLSPLIPEYRNIIDCQFRSVRLESYEVQNDVHTAEVTVHARPLFLEGVKVKERPETIHLRLERLSPAEQNNPLILHSIRCSTCGASLDLTEGNTCPHCGNRWDLRRWDWCIMEYKRLDQ